MNPMNPVDQANGPDGAEAQNAPNDYLYERAVANVECPPDIHVHAELAHGSVANRITGEPHDVSV